MILRKEDYIAVNNINKKGLVSYYPQFFTFWVATHLKRIIYGFVKLLLFLQTVENRIFFGFFIIFSFELWFPIC